MEFCRSSVSVVGKVDSHTILPCVLSSSQETEERIDAEERETAKSQRESLNSRKKVKNTLKS
jgi:hypothetical protein